MQVERFESNGMSLAVESFGDRERPTVILVMGLAAQRNAWPDEFCEALSGHRHVIRFDNRDAGESTHLDAPVPDLRACLSGDTSSAVYTLEDMADDVTGLLDALGLRAAHLVGASMGGMIVQTVASRRPERVLSLTSIMSTTGERGVSQPTEEAAATLLQPAARNREEAIDRALMVARVIGSPGFPRDEPAIRERAATAWDRGHDPAGFARQLAAIYAAGDRTQAVRRIAAPALVVHGEADPLIPVAAGHATAAAIPAAELWTVPGMAHDLPRALWPELAARITALSDRGERTPGSAPSDLTTTRSDPA